MTIILPKESGQIGAELDFKFSTEGMMADAENLRKQAVEQASKPLLDHTANQPIVTPEPPAPTPDPVAPAPSPLPSFEDLIKPVQPVEDTPAPETVAAGTQTDAPTLDPLSMPAMPSMPTWKSLSEPPAAPQTDAATGDAVWPDWAKRSTVASDGSGDGGAAPSSGTTSTFRPTAPAGDGEIETYIRQAARARGIDPDVAIAVADTEGGHTEPARRGTFSTGSSWWPFQLHYGGAGYEQYGDTAGMGNSFTAKTGIQPGDPNGWKQSVDYALDAAKTGGWDPWYGAKAIGITGMQGIGNTPVAGGNNGQSGSTASVGYRPGSQGGSGAVGQDGGASSIAGVDAQAGPDQGAPGAADQVTTAPSHDDWATAEMPADFARLEAIRQEQMGGSRAMLADNAPEPSNRIASQNGAETGDLSNTRQTNGTMRDVPQDRGWQNNPDLYPDDGLRSTQPSTPQNDWNPDGVDPQARTPDFGNDPGYQDQTFVRPADHGPATQQDPWSPETPVISNRGTIKGVPIAEALAMGGQFDKWGNDGSLDTGNSGSAEPIGTGSVGPDAPANDGSSVGTGAGVVQEPAPASVNAPPPARDDYRTNPGLAPATAPTFQDTAEQPFTPDSSASPSPGAVDAPGGGALTSPPVEHPALSAIRGGFENVMSGLSSLFGGGNGTDTNGGNDGLDIRSVGSQSDRSERGITSPIRVSDYADSVDGQNGAQEASPVLRDVSGNMGDSAVNRADTQSVSAENLTAPTKFERQAQSAQAHVDAMPEPAGPAALAQDTVSAAQTPDRLAGMVNGFLADQVQKYGETQVLNAKWVATQLQNQNWYATLPPDEQARAQSLSEELMQNWSPIANGEVGSGIRGLASTQEAAISRLGNEARAAGRTVPEMASGIVSGADNQYPLRVDSTQPRSPQALAESFDNRTKPITDRYYHGTSSDFQNPNGDLWLTDDPNAASMFSESRQSASTNAGPNVRAVDVPQDLRLLDPKNPAHAKVIEDAQLSAAGKAGLDDALASQIMSQELVAAGYDGIRVARGGENRLLIFKDALDSVTNATAGTPGGLLPEAAAPKGSPQAVDQAMARLGGQAAYGGVAGAVSEAQNDPNATPTTIGTAAFTGAAERAVLGAARGKLGPNAGGTIARVVRATGGAARDSMKNSGSPELERIANMMDEPVPSAPELPQAAGRVDRAVRSFTQKLTDSNTTMDNIQKDVLNSKLSVEEKVSALQRLNPESAVDMQIQREIMPTLRQLGEDRPYSSTIATLKQNLNQADTIGRKVEADYHKRDIGVIQGQKRVDDLTVSVDRLQERTDQAWTRGDTEQHRQLTDVLNREQALLNNAEQRLQQATVTAQQSHAVAAQQAGQTARETRAFSGGLNAAESQKALDDLKAHLGPQKFAEMEQAARVMTDFNDGSLQLAEAGHIVDPKATAEWRANNPDYSPTRVIKYATDDGPGGVPVGKKVGLGDNGYKALSVEGTTAAKQDPWEASVAARYDVMRRVTRNEITEKFLDTAKANQDLGQHVQEIISMEQYGKQKNKLLPGQVLEPKKQTPDQTRIGWFDKNAVKHEYLVDDWATPLINGATVPEMNAYEKFLKEWKGSVTDRSIKFTERNAPRDFWGVLHNMLVAEGGPTPGNIKQVAQDLVTGYRAAFKGMKSGTFHDDTFDYLAAGGGYDRPSGRGLEGQRQRVDDIARTGGIEIKTPLDFYKWATDPISALNMRLEFGPRTARFRQEMRLSGGNDVQSVIAARDLMPYEVAGDFIRVLNRGIPFLAPRVAAVASQVRLAQKSPKAYFATSAFMGVAPAVAIEAYNRMDPDRAKAYDDLPPYLKAMGNIIMFPTAGKPNDPTAGKDIYGMPLPNYLFLPTGVVTPWALLGHGIGAALMGKNPNPNDAAELFDGLVSSMAPVDTAVGGAVSNILGPGGNALAAMATNKDVFRGSDISTNQNNLEASRFSQLGAGAANKVLGAVPVVGPKIANQSPAMWDYQLKNATGDFGSNALAASNIGRPQIGDASAIQDMPVIGGLVSPLVGNRSGGVFTQESGRIMASRAGDVIRQSGVRWEPLPVDSMIGKVPLTRAEHGEAQREYNRQFSQLVLDAAADPDWAGADTSVREAWLKGLDQAARKMADAAVAPNIPDDQWGRRLDIQNQRKAG